MTLNAVMALILHYFTEFSIFRAHYVKVIEDRPIVFATECPKNTEITNNECIVERHLRIIDASLICVGA